MRSFTEDEIIGTLREHEAQVTTAKVCRKHGISDTSFYNWKAKLGGTTVLEAARLRTLKDENRRLEKPAGSWCWMCRCQRIGWEKSIRSVDLYPAMEKLMADHGFSECRACRLIAVTGRRGSMSRIAGTTMLSTGASARLPTRVAVEFRWLAPTSTGTTSQSLWRTRQDSNLWPLPSEGREMGLFRTSWNSKSV